MIEFTRPLPMKKTCTMHPERKSVRSVSFTDFNDNSVTVTLCDVCLVELKVKASSEWQSVVDKPVETHAVSATGLWMEEDGK